jgi:6-phosphogluconolactonase
MSRNLGVCVQPDRHAVSRRTAEIVRDAVRNATREAPALLLLSGGSSVLDACVELTQWELPWHALHVGQLDERVATASHPERAWPAIEASLLDRTTENVAGRHPILVDELDSEQAASSYDAILGRLTERMHTSIAVCGLGEDGHVASLLAGDEKNRSRARVLTTGPYSGLLRITVSMTFLRTLPTIIVVASGRSKAKAMQRLTLPSPDMPAAYLPSHTIFVIDRQAAALMHESADQG